MNKKTEKKRCSNFSSYEINLLTKLVDERNQILKSPKLDAITVEKRNIAWREITALFNSDSLVSVFRSEEKLKKKYSNIRCERNKAVKKMSKVEGRRIGANEIPQANDNAVAEIVSGNEAIEVKKEELENKSMDEPIKQVQEILTQEDSESHSDSSFSYDDDEPELQLNEYEISQLNEKMEDKLKWSTEMFELETDILLLKHSERMKLINKKHDFEIQRVQMQSRKFHFEHELLNAEMAVKRKKVIDGFKEELLENL